MSTDNHLAKFKQFAERQVKFYESKQNKTEEEKEFFCKSSRLYSKI